MLGKKATHVQVTNIFLGGTSTLGQRLQGTPQDVVEKLKQLVEAQHPGVAKLTLSEYCKLHNHAFAQVTDDPEVTLRIMSGFHGGQHWIKVERVKWDDGSETDYLW